MDRSYTEIGVSALIAGVCVVVWIAASKLPPGTFEPLGSGPVPKYTSAIIFVTCLLVIVRAARRLAALPDRAGALRSELIGGKPLMAVFLFALSIGYVAILQSRSVPFAPLSAVYLLLLIWGMEGFAPRKFLPALATAVIAAFGAGYVFTRIFIVDLPV
ncbi:MAG: tripartite tricarboxylate transporter TctB family protein [Pseudorhodobacter sp.]